LKRAGNAMVVDLQIPVTCVTALPFQGDFMGCPDFPRRCLGLKAALALRAEEQTTPLTAAVDLSG